MARPLTPGPASQPRVAGKGGGDGLAGAGGAGGGLGGAPSNRHSVRRTGAAAAPVAEPSTRFASKASTSRIDFAPSAGLRQAGLASVASASSDSLAAAVRDNITIGRLLFTG